MTVKVLLGGNELVDCATIVAVRGERLLWLDVDPLRVNLVTPPGWSDDQAIAVVQNHLKMGPASARVLARDGAVTVVASNIPVVMAMVSPEDPGEVHLRIDLRPLGIDLFDDARGLHLGSNLYAKNRVSSTAVAISLG